MFDKLREFLCFLALLIVFVGLPVGLLGGTIWYMTRPTTYDFGNGARLEVPSDTASVDHRDKGYGVVIQSGVNVTVYNDADEWRTLTVSYRKYNFGGILDNFAHEDLPPKSSKRFGVDSRRYEGMYVSVSDHAQKERDKTAK